MGSVPLMFATGPGSVSRQNLGVVIFAGVGVATLFTLFVVPAFYHVLARRTGSPGEIARKLEALQQSNSQETLDDGVPHGA
jgi:multidrug efflux pump